MSDIMSAMVSIKFVDATELEVKNQRKNFGDTHNLTTEDPVCPM